MSTARLYFPIELVFDSVGETIAGGKLNTYEAGTSTPLATYADEALTTPLANPVVADGSGKFSEIFLLNQDYKLVLTDADDVVIWTVDNYSPIEVSGKEDFTASNYIKRKSDNSGWDNKTATEVFTDTKQDATATTTGVSEIATQAEVDAGTDTTRYVTPATLKSTLTTSGIGLATTNRGYIDGFQTVNNSGSPNTDIDFGAGEARYEDDTGAGKSTALTKELNNDWAAGDAAGGLAARKTLSGTFLSAGTAVTGAGSDFANEFVVGDVLYSSSNGENRRITVIGGPTSITLASAFTANVVVAENVQTNGTAPSTTYHCFALYDASDITAFDFGFDTRTDASLLLGDTAVIAAGFDKYRRIGSVLVNASGNITQYIQHGDYFYLDTPVAQYAAAFSTTASSVSLTSPLNIENIAIINAHMNILLNANSGLFYGYFSSLNGPDVAAGASNAHLYCTAEQGGFQGFASTQAEVQTNTASQIRRREGQAGGTIDTATVNINSIGWIDLRGKDS